MVGFSFGRSTDHRPNAAATIAADSDMLEGGLHPLFVPALVMM
jgi:hypothetical protein